LRRSAVLLPRRRPRAGGALARAGEGAAFVVGPIDAGTTPVSPQLGWDLDPVKSNRP
jgi:hypothetical protein